MRAGAVLSRGVSSSAVDPFRVGGVELELLPFDGPRPQLDALLVFGGDGTLHHQLKWLVETRTPLLIVPQGSGNDFAHQIGIGERENALERWRQFVGGQLAVRELDVGVIGDASGAERYFCNIAGAGLDTTANRIANSFPRALRKHGGYTLAALLAILIHRPTSVRLSIQQSNGEWKDLFTGQALVTAVANTRSYGGGIQIAPEAKPDDGHFDVCVIRTASRSRMLRLLPKVRHGEHAGLPEISFFRGSNFRIETPQPQPIFADGEYIGETTAEIRVLPRALRAIAPHV